MVFYRSSNRYTARAAKGRKPRSAINHIINLYYTDGGFLHSLLLYGFSLCIKAPIRINKDRLVHRLNIIVFNVQDRCNCWERCGRRADTIGTFRLDKHNIIIIPNPDTHIQPESDTNTGRYYILFIILCITFDQTRKATAGLSTSRTAYTLYAVAIRVHRRHVITLLFV